MPKTHISIKNLAQAYQAWPKTDEPIAPIEQVSLFLRYLAGDTDLEVEDFEQTYDTEYTQEEIASFHAVKDTLIEDDARRRQGAFYTPEAWVNEAHKEIEAVLGPNWKEECIVWDNSCGGCNLTRDYVFSDLILSTYEEPDVKAIVDHAYNPGSKVFQLDFLNIANPHDLFEGKQNCIPLEVENHLKNAAKEGKRLVFLMNPPYGTAGIGHASDLDQVREEKSRENIAKTDINVEMRTYGIGGVSSSQLYTQFLYASIKEAEHFGFKDVTLAFFSKTTFMCSDSAEPFRKWWLKKVGFQKGFYFQASNFSDVGARWGISFTIWSSGVPSTVEYPVSLKEMKDSEIQTFGEKTFYTPGERHPLRWLVEPKGGQDMIDVAHFSSGLSLSERKVYRQMPSDYLCYFGNEGNQPSGIPGIYMMSSADSRANGLSVTHRNWRKAVAFYAARKLVTGNWINDKDEYMIPEVGKPGYDQWVDDCHIYGLLQNTNNCTSMRDVQYKKKSWRIKNHWFWETRETVLGFSYGWMKNDCAQEPVKEPIEDIIGVARQPEAWEQSGDAYMAHVLNGLDLSPEACEVLVLLKKLWRRSLPERESYAMNRPELHLLTWDAGIYQLKHLWRDSFPDKWEELQVAYRTLAKKLKPGIYDFGFMRK